MIPTLLLAAGQSLRMLGRDKLLEPINGLPILRTMAERALAVGPTYATVPDLGHPRCTALPQAVHLVPVQDAKLGLSHSLRAGVRALPETASGILILPADMPDITAFDIATIKAHAIREDAKIVRATTADAKPGHPIYFDCTLFPLFETLTGDRGAFAICAEFQNQTEFVPLNGNRARLDLDTPEDWKNYREGSTQ